MISHLKLALKVLGRRKVFTFISLFGISLTMLVLIVGAAILDNVFAPRSPETRYDRTLYLYTLGLYGKQGGYTGGPGYRFLDRYVRGLEGAEAISIFSDMNQAGIFQDGRKIETHLKRTDGGYWRVLDFHFLEGGPFTQADDDAGRQVAVITEDLRRQLFGGESALGKTFNLDGQRFRIVGVVPNVPITRVAAFSEIWTPIHTMKQSGWERQVTGHFSAMVLAHDRADLRLLKSRFQQRLAGFVFDDPKSYNLVVAGLDTGFEAFARSFFAGPELKDKTIESRATLMRLIFIAMALLFVTLPTMNLVSLNLSRILERASEIGVRKAFGASSRSLIGQFVLENIVLTLIGGAIGFVLALFALSALTRAEFIPYAIFDVNVRIFGYGMLLAATFGALSGAYPAWRMSKLNPVEALRGGAR